MVHHECSNFAKQVDTEALKEKAKNAERKARKQIFLEASLAAAKEAITYSNIEGLELPKQNEINDKRFSEKVDSTYEEIYKGIEKELKIEQEKARIDKDTSEEADKELCEANLEQLFSEVVTEIVDQRMKMEDDESKNETGKLIELLKVKHKTQNMGYHSVEAGSRTSRNHPRPTAWRKEKDRTAQ